MTRFLVLLLACSGCVLARGGPDFEQWHKTVPYQAPRGPHQGPTLTFEVLSAQAYETFTALGIQQCTVSLELRVTNHSAQPYVIERGENAVETQVGQRLERQQLTFSVSDRTFAPGQTLQTRHQTSLNPFSCARPGALVLDGVRVPITR